MSIKLYNINEEYREKFYQIPKVFFTNPKYIKLSNDAKMAWGILRDRLDLSIKNGWVDSKTGNIYFYYKNENPQNILNCKKDKVIKIKKELN
ncbi:replication initiation protein [Staphylococcus aureus]|nr:replication initiator protein A [Staphylococcus aureus]EGL84571.1 replication initiator protein A, N-terminal domain protein [Staphylococcus aureus subsp. aureus 21305]EHM68030.1 replication initiator protein A, N-terminal domain protein [Staphylococcus aureus subsp. aureus VCU006]EHM84217.1 replication initiator protein A, N-terminal domain protein [Staphylococcus aureus subsp. aureus 21340]EHT92237.1 replication initiator A family protein [Staphylococcus aureus subsp. aureus CIGC128]ELY15